MTFNAILSLFCGIKYIFSNSAVNTLIHVYLFKIVKKYVNILNVISAICEIMHAEGNLRYHYPKYQQYCTALEVHTK